MLADGYQLVAVGDSAEQSISGKQEPFQLEIWSLVDRIEIKSCGSLRFWSYL